MSLRLIATVAVALLLIAGTILLMQSEPIEVEVPQVALPAVTPEPVLPLPPVVTPEPELPVEAPQVVPPVVATPKPVEIKVPPLPALDPVPPPPLPEPEPEPVVIPDDFIVDNEHWKNAFILGRPDGLKGPRGVGFSDIPIGTEIRAPISGYILLYTARWEGIETAEIVISEYEDGFGITENSRFFFLANDFYPINISGRIEKGDVVFKIRDESEVFPGFFDRKTIFAMGFKGDWNTDLTIEDPREFLWVPIQEIVGED